MHLKEGESHAMLNDMTTTLKNIAFERTDSIEGDGPSLNLVGLCVFETTGSRDVQSFALVNYSPGRWKVDTFIELTAETDAIVCVVQSDMGEDIGFLYLNRKAMGSTQAHSAHEFSQEVEICDEQMGLTMRWKGIGIPPDRFQVDDDVATQSNEYGVDRLRAFERTGELSALTDAISYLQRGVDLTPRGHADLPRYLNELGNAFSSLFDQTGGLSNISEAIVVQRKGVDLTPSGDINLPCRLSNLGGSLTRRFEQTGQLSDIADAISVRLKAVDLIPDGHADLPAILNHLGSSFMCRFERMGELSDIEEAILLQRKAIDVTPHDPADQPAIFSNLGLSLTIALNGPNSFRTLLKPSQCSRKQWISFPTVMLTYPLYSTTLGVRSPVASNGRKALALTPQVHPNFPLQLNNLGNFFTRRFQQTGQLSDIAEAISAQREAIDLTPPGHASLSSYLNNLGISINCRFEKTGELLDIAEAIVVQQRAVELCPQDQGWAGLQNIALGSEKNLSPQKLNQPPTPHFRVYRGGFNKILAAKRLNQPPMYGPDYRGLPIFLNNLGLSLTRRFERTGEDSDIAHAISVRQKAVNLIPQGHADLAGYLTNLGSSFASRFARTGDLPDIVGAIEVQQKAVDLTPQGHADLPGRLSNLGSSFYRRFRLSRDTEDLEEALSRYKAAAVSPVGSPRARLNPAQCWARRLIEYYPRSPEIIPAFDTVIALVAMIAGLEQTVQGRYTQLEDVSTLALEAAAVACELDRPDKALEWLEQGRCLVWSQLNNLRTPLDDLRIHDELLAHDIAEVSKKLEHAGSSRGQSLLNMSLPEKMSLENEARVHLDLARKWDDLLSQARAIPGFESFLMPLACSHIMQHLPESGPMVVINMDKRHCSALALLAGLDEPLHIPLPNFSIDEARKYRTILDSQLRTHNLRVREVAEIGSIDRDPQVRGIRCLPNQTHDEDAPIYQVLRGLWKSVVKPILGALAFSGLTYEIERGQNTRRDAPKDLVVPNGTPVLSSPSRRRNLWRNRQSVNPKASGLLLTNQPDAPGASPIPGTTKEVRSIFKQAEASGVRVLKLEGDEMSVAGCLNRMQDFSSIHLACHGSQNAAEPLQSHFLFHKGPLELGTILRSNLKHADLAFLSACQTSTGQGKLSDEAVHLTAGMLAAGYYRVIGTMWSIGDVPAQEVSTAFYEYLFSHQHENGSAKFDGTLSAVALHHATQQLRLSINDSEHSLLTWIPFVHFGL
ncbi:CHAT domain-containing protein [Ephemerocybe angulata]|uniref:CHAT domain-containing protein n=1 Tax=Ephemerocybe angulata TaxID=980116 RepID=A0A8H6LZN6_9AGAR|nr:CHAT domain-containing protein [Tulosesus angulatus]